MSDAWLRPWALGSVAFGGASLLVPLYVVQLGGTAFHLGILAASAALIGAPGAVLFGRLTRYTNRRRPLVLATLLLVALMLALIPGLTHVWLVVGANAMLWFVVAAVGPIVTTIVLEDAAEPDWGPRLGALNRYQGFGWAFGLVIGTAWPTLVGQALPSGLVLRVLFVVLAVVAGISGVSVARRLPRAATDEGLSRGRTARRAARLLVRTHRGVRGTTFSFSPNQLYWATLEWHPGRLKNRMDDALFRYLAATALFSSGFAAFWAPLPLFLTEAGLASGEVFGLYLVSSLGSAALYGTVGRMASTDGLDRLQASAVGIRGVLFPAVSVLGGMAASVLGMAVLAVVFLGIGITWAVIALIGTTILTRLAPVGLRGDVLASAAAVVAVSGGVGGLLGGVVSLAGGHTVAFALAGGLALSGAVLVASIGADRLDGASVTD